VVGKEGEGGGADGWKSEDGDEMNQLQFLKLQSHFFSVVPRRKLFRNETVTEEEEIDSWVYYY
jgi:hypothetical protein